MLKVENLTKQFKKVDQKTKQKSYVGIKNINFQANEGRIFGLIGANGAGKTTTMRIIANLTYQHSGNIFLDGKSYKDIPDLKMKVSFVSGETQVFDRLTGYEILSLFGEFAGFSKRELEERIAHLVQKLNMGDFINSLCINYSTGMKQKVSIARALITNPKILVFDEVTNGLDIFASKAVRDEIKELKDEGKIILYSTHIMSDAEELCDDISIIHKGEILESGDVSELKSKYKIDSIEDIFFELVRDKL